jgi:hypothetical protein
MFDSFYTLIKKTPSTLFWMYRSLQTILQELLLDFHASRYAKMTPLLSKATLVLSLDPWLAPHASALLRDVFIRSTLQFVSPYAMVKLDKMAEAFGMPLASMEVGFWFGETII